MYESPRDRRLRSDLRAITKLKTQSSILDFEGFENPPQKYIVTLRGRGLMQPPNTDEVIYADFHQVEIKLGSEYPRKKPDLKWRTPIFHPNISALGQVCLGGYSTNWVPSLNLDELCEMLWDMVRYANYDVKSPYNYKAARWVERQRLYEFPTDHRTLKDKLAAGLVSPDAPLPEPKVEPREEIIFMDDDQDGDDQQPDLFVIGEDR